MTAQTPAERGCECEPCPGRGNDGHGLTHCAECCFGTGVHAQPECPVHGHPSPNVAQTPAEQAAQTPAEQAAEASVRVLAHIESALLPAERINGRNYDLGDDADVPLWSKDLLALIAALATPAPQDESGEGRG